jgi:hypothetical protein
VNERKPEGLAAWVVVLPELPKTRETLPLRLFGDERTRRSLPQEIAALEPGDPMGPVVRGMLKTSFLWVRGQPQDENTRRWLMDFEQVVQAEIRKIERQGEEHGEKRGEKRGLQAAVGDLCELLGIVLTAEQQAHLEALDLAGLAALRAHLKQHRSWPVGLEADRPPFIPSPAEVAGGARVGDRDAPPGRAARRRAALRGWLSGTCGPPRR